MQRINRDGAEGWDELVSGRVSEWEGLGGEGWARSGKG